MLKVERPFGIYLWDLFGKVWETLMGYPVNQFEFIPGQTFLSSWIEVLSILLLYYMTIFVGQWIMKLFSPINLKTISKMYNLLMSVLSGIFLILLFEQIFPIIWNHGLFYSICDQKSWTQPLVTIYYINYIVKYIELMDTVFLFLKKKSLKFLHCYHHGATIFLCFTQLMGRTSVSYIPISLNLAVHVVMYYYYFLAACGKKVWWKQWVTRIQIIQFIFDLVFVYFATYTRVTYHYITFLPTLGDCCGKEFSAFIGCFFLSSYLVLFIGFYFATYKSKDKTNHRGLFDKKIHHHKLEDIDFNNLKNTAAKSTSVNNIGITTRSRKI